MAKKKQLPKNEDENNPIIRVKTFTVTVEERKNTHGMIRTNDGFHILELMGILQFAQLELLEQFKGKIKPDFVKRTVLTD